MSRANDDLPELEQNEGVTSFTTNDLNESNFTNFDENNNICGNIHRNTDGIQGNVSGSQRSVDEVGENDGSRRNFVSEDGAIGQEPAGRSENQEPNLTSTQTGVMRLLSFLSTNFGSELVVRPQQPAHFGILPLSSQPNELQHDSNVYSNQSIQTNETPQEEETNQDPRANGNLQSSSAQLAVQENLGYENDLMEMLEGDLSVNQEQVYVLTDSEVNVVHTPSSQIAVDQDSRPAMAGQPVIDPLNQHSQSSDHLIQTVCHAAESAAHVAQSGTPTIPQSGSRQPTPPPQADQLLGQGKIHCSDLNSSNDSLDFNNIRWDRVTLNSSSRSQSPICFELRQATFQAEEDRGITDMNRPTATFETGQSPTLPNGPVALHANTPIRQHESDHVYVWEPLSAGVYMASHHTDDHCPIPVRPDSRLGMPIDHNDDGSEDEAYYSPTDVSSHEDQLTPTSSESQKTVISVKLVPDPQQTSQHPLADGNESAGRSASALSSTPPARDLEPMEDKSKKSLRNAETGNQEPNRVHVTLANSVFEPIAFSSQIVTDSRRGRARSPTLEELYAILPADPSTRADRQVGSKPAGAEVIDMFDRAAQEDERSLGALRACLCYLGIILFVTAIGFATLLRTSIANIILSWLR